MDEHERIIEEHLLLQYLRGQADPTTRASVEAWLMADSGNRKLLDQLESLWRETGALKIAPVAVDIDAAWKKMERRIGSAAENNSQAGTVAKPKSVSLFRYVAGAAAAILIFIGLWFLLKVISKPANPIELTGNITIKQDTLPDGTRIFLNTGSTLRYDRSFNATARAVTLKGTCFFEVAPDPARPFLITAGNYHIRVVGTKFIVRLNPQQKGALAEVNVTEGKVLFWKNPVDGDSASTLLTAGMSARWSPEDRQPQVNRNIPPDDLFWANHSLEFTDMPLAGVFPILEKYYDIKIGADDPLALQCRLTASFSNDPPDRIMAVIAESFGLKLESEGRNFHLKGNGCKQIR